MLYFKRDFPSYSFIHSFISVWIHGFLFSLEVITISIIIYFIAQIIPHLITRAFFVLASVSFWHVSIILWAIPYFLAQDVLVQIMSFSCTCHGISHFSKEHEKLFGNSDSEPYYYTNWTTIQKMGSKPDFCKCPHSDLRASIWGNWTQCPKLLSGIVYLINWLPSTWRLEQ